MNFPARESDALKPRQLHVARRCGLTVPDSQVTNSPAGVQEFARGVGGALVGKTLAAALLVESGRLQIAYTRRIEPTELDDLAGVDTTLHFFQPFLNKSWEARVTVVGDRVFGAAIHAGSDAARVDWRSDYDSLDYEVVEPPEPVTAGMVTFLKAPTAGWRRHWTCRSPRRWPTCSPTVPSHADFSDRPQPRRAEAGPGPAP